MTGLLEGEWLLGSFCDSMFWESAAHAWLVCGGMTFGVVGAGMARCSLVLRW